MGEVSRARDTRLNRDVAIKISAQQFTDRFERNGKVGDEISQRTSARLIDRSYDLARVAKTYQSRDRRCYRADPARCGLTG